MKNRACNRLLLAICVWTACWRVAIGADVSTKTVLSLESLGDVEAWEDVQKAGILMPNEGNLRAARNVILLALKPGAVHKGSWVRAIGLWGTSMLPESNVRDRLAFEQLFASIGTHECKLAAVGRGERAALLIEYPSLLPSKEIRTLWGQREGAILGLVDGIESRFLYGPKGNYPRGGAATVANFRPNPQHLVSHRSLEVTVPNARALHKTLADMGFDDKTLASITCIGAAVLQYDGRTDWESLSTSETPVICQDALKATIEELSNAPTQMMHLFEELCLQLGSRNLPTYDVALFPENEKSLNALLRIVASDIDSWGMAERQTNGRGP